MTPDPLAVVLAPRDSLVDPGALRSAYYARMPDVLDRTERVRFGAGGHRGSALRGSFTEWHVLALTQAICDYRTRHDIGGPLFLGRDTHALSEPAFMTAIEVLAANRVHTFVDRDGGCTPTPLVSHAILTHNHGRTTRPADGIVITASHHPPEDGGIRYAAPTGGPPDGDTAAWIEQRANELLAQGPRRLFRTPYERARRAATTRPHDYVGAYVDDLPSVVDLDAIRSAKLRIAVDPLGGASVACWDAIAERHRLDLELVNRAVDPTFAFMPLDRDGRIRMDCTSPYAMERLVRLRDGFDLAFATDPDAGRHGIVTRGAGLMDSNRYFVAAVFFLFKFRPRWRADAAVGKTVVGSGVIDRVAAKVGRALVEVPAGFTWFVPGLLDGSLGFGAEERAGATCLRRDGTVWTTATDGIVLDLVAAEMTARTGRDPFELYDDLTHEIGTAVYERVDVPATPDERARLQRMTPDDIGTARIAGDPIRAVRTAARGNGAPIGGVQVVTDSGWFAACPSATDAIYALYAESFRDRDHLRRIQDEASALVADALAASRVMRWRKVP